MNIEGAFFNTTDYEILDKKLGNGAFGTVYIARNLNDDKKYAAKIINVEDCFDGHEQMQFFRESLILHKLSHPSIVKFKGVNLRSITDPTKLEPTIITEYLPHGSLKENLNKEKKSFADANWSATKKYIALLGIADAMRYLHENGIIHRDLKPENILIDENYYPRVCDFGLAKCFSQALTKSMKLTITGKLGTPLYMAPELFKDEENYGPGVDVYAFSILAYEIVTGKDPQDDLGQSITPFKLAKKVIEGYRPKLTEDIPEKMKKLLSECWSDKIEERPSFAEIFEKLSNDFSYSPESVDEDEICEYLAVLEEKRNEYNKDVVEPNNHQKEEIEKLQQELKVIKEKIQKYENEHDSFNKSNVSYFTGLSNLYGGSLEKNLNKAIINLTKSSDEGNSYASFLLGLLYENGEVVKKDFNLAFTFYEKSSQQGNSFGYNRIGLCYELGFSTEQDYSKAHEYYLKAAEMGNPSSYNNLGILYRYGKNCDQDYIKAIDYFLKAVELGYTTSYNNIGSIYESRTDGYKDYAKSLEYYQKAAAFGDSFSFKKIGML